MGLLVADGTCWLTARSIVGENASLAEVVFTLRDHWVCEGLPAEVAGKRNAFRVDIDRKTALANLPLFALLSLRFQLIQTEFLASLFLLPLPLDLVPCLVLLSNVSKLAIYYYYYYQILFFRSNTKRETHTWDAYIYICKSKSTHISILHP